MNDDTAHTLEWLKECLVRKDKQHINDVVQRRIYVVGQDIVFSNPFNDVDETLYSLWRKPIPAPLPVDPTLHFDQIEIGDWW